MAASDEWLHVPADVPLAVWLPIRDLGVLHAWEHAQVGFGAGAFLVTACGLATRRSARRTMAAELAAWRPEPEMQLCPSCSRRLAARARAARLRVVAEGCGPAAHAARRQLELLEGPAE